MEVTCKEVAGFIELSKRKAELEFAQTVIGKDVSTELKPLCAKMDAIASNLRRAGIEIMMPHQSELDALTKKLKELPESEVRESFIDRRGPAYDIIVRRGAVVRKNFLNRMEISKLSVVSARLETSEKASLAETIYFSRMGQKLTLASADEATRKNIAKLLNRCGVFCNLEGDSVMPATNEYGDEVYYDLPTGRAWVRADRKSEIDMVISQINALIPKVQLKNAEIQVKKFNEQEQAEYESIQKQYLDLLKKKDDLLKEHFEEEKISVKIN